MNTTTATTTATAALEHDPSGRGCALAGRTARNPRIAQTGDECEACMVALGWTSDPEPEPEPVRLGHCTPSWGGHSPACDRDGSYCAMASSHDGPCRPHGAP